MHGKSKGDFGWKEKRQRAPMLPLLAPSAFPPSSRAAMLPGGGMKPTTTAPAAPSSLGTVVPSVVVTCPPPLPQLLLFGVFETLEKMFVLFNGTVSDVVNHRLSRCLISSVLFLSVRTGPSVQWTC